MKKLLFLFLIVFVSCQSQQKDITGHWNVLRQYADGEEITPLNPGLTFGADGILQLEWNQQPNIKLPETHYRVAGDTIYWTSSAGERPQDGKLIIEWEGEHLILKADKNNYTVLERTTK